MSYFNQRISKLEASNQTSKWIMIDEHGNLPDNFNPETDGFIVATIQGEQKHLFWKGEPYQPKFDVIAVIGGEQP